MRLTIHLLTKQGDDAKFCALTESKSWKAETALVSQL